MDKNNHPYGLHPHHSETLYHVPHSQYKHDFRAIQGQSKVDCRSLKNARDDPSIYVAEPNHSLHLIELGTDSTMHATQFLVCDTLQ